MITYTLADILALPHCYEDPTPIVDWFAGRETVTVADIAASPFPLGDRLWALWRLHGPHIAAAQAATVERAVRTHCLPCEATREWAERWLSGEDRTRASAARAAADARAAYAPAARAAYAAYATAYANATYAATYAGTAADDAPDSGELGFQLADLVAHAAAMRKGGQG